MELKDQNDLKELKPIRHEKKKPQKRQLRVTTLNEPIVISILRDLRQILQKIKLVILPFGSKNKRIKTWDLWGPLVLCILLAYTLSIEASPKDTNKIFGAIFSLIWIGAGVVTLNAKLLKGTVSFFHCVCTLGYSLFPMNLSAIFCVCTKDFLNFFFAVGVTFVGLFWSCKSATKYLEGLVQPEKRGISLYPVFLFYTFLFFFILQMTQ
jgi:hypothetical protein